jgi:CBS domain-containing protein
MHIAKLQGMEALRIHRRRILDARGFETLEEVVDCPRDGRVRLLLACSSCGYACGISHDPRIDGDVVSCTEAHEPPKSEHEAVARSGGLDTIRTVPVADLCTRDVYCAMPDTPIEAVRRLLLKHAIGVVVVVTAARAPTGLVSATDLVRAPPEARHVSDVMTPSPITVPIGLSLARVAAVMAYEGVHHLPVVGPGGRLVGLVSSVDLLREIGRASGAIIPDRTVRRTRKEREKEKA